MWIILWNLWLAELQLGGLGKIIYFLSFFIPCFLIFLPIYSFLLLFSLILAPFCSLLLLITLVYKFLHLFRPFFTPFLILITHCYSLLLLNNPIYFYSSFTPHQHSLISLNIPKYPLNPPIRPQSKRSYKILEKIKIFLTKIKFSYQKFT